jgi:prophage DNA circulation protein
VTAFQANLETGLRRETLGTAILGLFSAALAAGVTAVAFRALRDHATAGDPRGDLARWVRISFRRQALIAETRRYAVTAFTNRDAVEAVRAGLTAAFDDVIEEASETSEFQVMRDLVSLFTAIQRHLASSAVPLPRLISYSTPASLPSLVLAHRLYGDASRRTEIERENRVIHPLFMPVRGRALAS